MVQIGNELSHTFVSLPSIFLAESSELETLLSAMEKINYSS